MLQVQHVTHRYIERIKMTQLVLTAASWLNFSAVINRLRDIKRSYDQARAISNTIKELSKLSDAELRDIGLSRGDIYSIAHEGYFDNHGNLEINRNLRGWV